MNKLILLGLVSLLVPCLIQAKSSPSVGAQRDYDLKPWLQKHQQFVANTKKNGSNIKVLFLGDSITAHWLTSGINEWNGKYRGLGAVDYGIGGDQVENVLWRVQNGEVEGLKPKLVVLMIGTNNIGVHSDTEIGNGIRILVQEIRKRLPISNILLLGILPRGDAKKTVSADNINTQIAKLDNRGNIRFLNMRNQFYNSQAKNVKADLYVSDKLHLNLKGYQTWSETMKNLFNQLNR